MDFEAPMDAWVVYIGVALVSMTLLGVALGFSPIPPPDANAAANTIDMAGGSSITGEAEYEQDAEWFWMDQQQIALKNEGGQTKATIAFGEMTAVHYDERLSDVLYGSPVSEEFSSEYEFLAAVVAAQAASEADRGDWQPANGEIRARKVIVGDTDVILVDV